jgi:hypothetical protein
MKWHRLQLILSKHHGSRLSIQASWRLTRIGKTTNERSSIFSQSVRHCNLTRTKRGWNGKRREEGRSTSSDTHAMAKDEAMERSDTQKNTSTQTTCRVPRPRCTKCTKTSQKFSAMQLSPQEPKRRYGLQGISIQGLRHNKTKRREGAQDSPSFAPLAIAMTGFGEVESK